MFDHPRPPQNQNKPVVAGLDRRYRQGFLSDHLRNANLQQLGSVNKEAKDLRFNTNEQFWHDVIRSRYGGRINLGLRWVELSGFQIIDWFPRTPGLYHTPDAVTLVMKQSAMYVKKMEFYFLNLVVKDICRMVE